jgi:hypothetical protein
MNLKQQQKLVAVHRQLAQALKKSPSHTCKNCKDLAGTLASVTAIYSDVLDGVIKGEIRRSFARRILSTVVDVVKAYTRS